MRTLGALQHPQGAVGWSLRHLVGVKKDIPSEAMLSRMPKAGLDQTGSSCYGCSFRHAFESYGLIVSGMAIYAGARQIGGQHRKSLLDEGTYQRNVVDAVFRFGLVARNRWPDNVDPTVPIPPDVFEAGSIARADGVYATQEQGEARLELIRSAISQEHPIVIATNVDYAFEHWNSDLVWSGVVGGSLGGHAMCLVGYRPGAFRVLNSWGLGWGDGGFAWIAESIIANDVYDVSVITAAPSRVE